MREHICSRQVGRECICSHKHGRVNVYIHEMAEKCQNMQNVSSGLIFILIFSLNFTVDIGSLKVVFSCANNDFTGKAWYWGVIEAQSWAK